MILDEIFVIVYQSLYFQEILQTVNYIVCEPWLQKSIKFVNITGGNC